MSMLGGLLGGGLLGLGGNDSRSVKYRKYAKQKLLEKPQPLEIPTAYKDLMAHINDQYMQAGDSQSKEIRGQFGQNLAKALAQLNMRGLSSSNLTANLTAGNTKKQEEAVANARFGLLGQQLGAQQNIGLGGLAQRSGQNAQLAGIQGSMFGNLGQNFLTPDTSRQDMLKGIALLAGMV